MYIGTPIAQGDVLFIQIDAIPPEAKRQNDNGRIVVAHSETGHHHAIDAAQSYRFEIGDPLICYLKIDDTFAQVVHHRSFDTHAPVCLDGGGKVYEVRRQREHSPDGWRRVED